MSEMLVPPYVPNQQIQEDVLADANLSDGPNVQFPKFMWLEITGKCQLNCDHCYAESSPDGTHGTMQEQDWRRVIGEASDGGVERVQFIGGEPTLHPALPGLIDYALGKEVKVEVYSNLTHIRPKMWETLSREGVSLATSYYSNNAAEHDDITKGRGSFRRTQENIAKAIELGIPLRAGLVAMRPEQQVKEAEAELLEIGVHPERIRTDHLREVGRGIRESEASIAQLCGRCTVNLAVGPEGQVWPCVFSRWLVAGNVQESSLTEILAGSELRGIRQVLDNEFARRSLGPTADCNPANCNPYCQPTEGTCVPDCPPSHNPCTPDIPQPCDPQNCGPAH